MSLNYHDPESYPKVENFNNVGEKNILHFRTFCTGCPKVSSDTQFPQRN